VENPALYLFTVQHPFPQSDIEFSPILHRIIDVYVTILTPFGIGKDETLHAARLLHSSIHGFLVNEILGFFPETVSMETSFEWMVMHLIDSFLPRTDLYNHL
jgi:Tetracyclin repressor-like, C-terminal domain